MGIPFDRPLRYPACLREYDRCMHFSAYGLLADAVLLLHLCFVAFVLAGGLLALRWPRLAWIHLPCAAWGAFVELAGWICPLTPLENRLRQAAGEAGFEGGFVEHYVMPLLYPGNLTREMQIILGLLVIGLNVLIYAAVWRRSDKRCRTRGPGTPTRCFRPPARRGRTRSRRSRR